MKTKKYIAFDIGASNGRCIVGEFNDKKISLDILARFENRNIYVLNHYYWDILGIFDQVKLSLRKAASKYKDNFSGIGVDTWGLDFGLFDKQGNMISNPFCYRDPQTKNMISEAEKRMPSKEIFQTTGLQFMEINTLYHLLAMVLTGSPALNNAKKFLMIPDIINYWLTGRGVCEYTNTSNTQLLNATTKKWAYPLIRNMGIPEHIFPEILEAGEILEKVRKSILDETGLPLLPVIATVTADTGAAVAGVPAAVENFAYLSSGTWGLLGLELHEPILNDKVQEFNFGNEGGVFNTIRLLKNITNLWLLQECRRIWSLEGDIYTWEELIGMAEKSKPFSAYIDPDQPQFSLPNNMPKTIVDTCRKTGQPVPLTKGEIIRICLESLVFKYRHTIDMLSIIQGKMPEVLHIVGGGAQNTMLCQLAANACKIPVIVGPVEATALGNIILQMIAIGDLKNHAEGRDLIRTSFPTCEYLPENQEIWEEEYMKFQKITGVSQILQ